MLGLSFCYPRRCSAISETSQIKRSGVWFCVSETDTDSKILAQRIRNFAEVSVEVIAEQLKSVWQVKNK